MQSVMWRKIETISPNKIQLRSGVPVKSASCSISSISSKSETLVAPLIVGLNTATADWLSVVGRLRQRRPSACSFNESSGRLSDFGRHLGLRRDKLWSEPWKETDQIMRHQDLAVTIVSRTDSDRRNP